MILNHGNLLPKKKAEHYSHILKNYSEFLPDEDEIYLAKFYRSDKLRNNPYIKLSIQKFILRDGILQIMLF